MTRNELIKNIKEKKDVISIYENYLEINRAELKDLELQLKDYINIKVGDTVNIHDFSYIQVFGENGLRECYNPTGTFVVRALNCKFDVGRHGQTNDAIVECNGRLYATQKEFLSKV